MGKLLAAFMVLVPTFLCSCQLEGRKNVAFLAGREIKSDTPRAWYWAQPMPVTGVPNCYKVSDDLVRGDEPSVNGLKRLQKMGVRTSVCVRSWGVHGTESRAKEAGLEYRQIYMVAWAPTEEDIVEFLRIMADPANRPVFIHCYTGGDRAGLLTAVYRVAFCGWPKSEARDEMLLGNYAFHQILVNYLVPFFEQLDIDRLKRQAGVTEASITEADRRFIWTRVKNTRDQTGVTEGSLESRAPLVNPPSDPYNERHETETKSAAGRAADRNDGISDGSLPRLAVRRQLDAERDGAFRQRQNLGDAPGPAGPAQRPPRQ